jgi:hypothetical protein
MKIAIFYHTFQNEISAFIYQQQINRLYVSGLLNSADYFHIGVNGNQEMFYVPSKAKVVYNTNCKEETETMIALKDFAYKNPDYKILYFHMKGASKGTLIANAWRLMMEHFVIDRWKECVEYLNDYDCVGANLNSVGVTLWPNGEITHPVEGTYNFTGNFWWANAKHIQTLDHKFLSSNYRIDRELWIGSNPNSNPKSIYQPGIYESYEHYYKEEDYMK